jgi:gamma-glutamylputrescine oxidase
MQLSYWEQQSYFEGIDLLIIGGGIVGLNAALAVKEIRPELKVLVIDRGAFLPYGASTRNAGFACFGSMSELIDDLQRNSFDEVFSLVQRRYEGLQRLRSLLKDVDIQYEENGGFEVFREEEEDLYNNCRSRIEEFNAELERRTGRRNIYSEASSKITDFGFGGVGKMILNSGEGQLDTGAMMKGLLHLVRSKNIEVLTGIEVKGWSTKAGLLEIETGNGFSITTAKMLITTNGFARQLLPDLEVEPGRAQVLITKPIDHLKFKGTFHYDKGYYYFRNVGDRVLFGGGRNLNFEAERTWDFDLTHPVQGRLEELLSQMILPGQAYEIDRRWSGIMGLGPTKSAIIREAEPHVFCAVRMGGMGVAIGSLVGREVAELICKG